MSEKFYCEYCGSSFPSVSSLTSNSCNRHPDGKGKHKLYEGGEKSQYTCKYCGQKFNSISSLTGNNCSRHPDGKNRRHSPAL